jgi:hypothetical protein
MSRSRRSDRPVPYYEKKNRLFEDCVVLDLALQHRKFCLRTLLRQFAMPGAPLGLYPPNRQASNRPLRLVVNEGERVHDATARTPDHPLTYNLEDQILKVRERLNTTAF